MLPSNDKGLLFAKENCKDFTQDGANLVETLCVDPVFFSNADPDPASASQKCGVKKKLRYEEFAVTDPHQYRQLGFCSHFQLNFFLLQGIGIGIGIGMYIF